MKLFNILINTKVWEWHRILQMGMGAEDEEELDRMMEALFAIFYMGNAYVVARDPVFLQCALDVLVNTLRVLVLILTPQRPRP